MCKDFPRIMQYQRSTWMMRMCTLCCYMQIYVKFKLDCHFSFLIYWWMERSILLGKFTWMRRCFDSLRLPFACCMWVFGASIATAIANLWKKIVTQTVIKTTFKSVSYLTQSGSHLATDCVFSFNESGCNWCDIWRYTNRIIHWTLDLLNSRFAIMHRWILGRIFQHFLAT